MKRKKEKFAGRENGKKGKQEEHIASKRKKQKKEWIILSITTIVKPTKSLQER